MKQQLEVLYERFKTSPNLSVEDISQAFYAYEYAFQSKWFFLAEQFLALCEPYLEQLPIPVDFFYRNRAICAHYLMQDDKKAYYFKQTAAHAIHPLQYAFEELTCLPHIYRSMEHIQVTRSQFQEGINHLCEQINSHIQAQTLNFPVSMGNTFLLAYQGRNDRTIMQQIGALWTAILGKQLIRVSHSPGSHQRIRIGFFSNYIYDHSIMVCYGHLMAYFGQAQA